MPNPGHCLRQCVNTPLITKFDIDKSSYLSWAPVSLPASTRQRNTDAEPTQSASVCGLGANVKIFTKKSPTLQKFTLIIIILIFNNLTIFTKYYLLYLLLDFFWLWLRNALIVNHKTGRLTRNVGEVLNCLFEPITLFKGTMCQHST